MFILTGCVSVWIAYDRSIGWRNSGCCSVPGWGQRLHQMTRRQLYIALAILLLGGVGLGLYSVMSSDWSVQQLKYPSLAALGAKVSGILPRVQGHRITPNVAGGMLAMLIPAVPLVFIRAGAWTGWRMLARGTVVQCWRASVCSSCF